MKLTVIIVTLSLLGLSAAEGIAQQVTLNEKNTSLLAVLESVKQQTGYAVFYKSEHLKMARPVSIRLTDVSLAEALTKIFSGQPLDYTIDEKTIVVREAPSSSQPNRHPRQVGTGSERSAAESNGSLLILAFPEVRGKIVDSLNQPLSGASIRVLDAQGKRTALQTQTDRNGDFLLRNVPEEASLEISYIGHIVVTMKVVAEVGMVILKAVPSELDEVDVTVNTGYQQLSKERATGSFTHIDSALLQRSVGSNILDRLDGVASGLIINRGLPGGGNSSYLTIRGRSTIFANPEPLVVLDGFPYEGDIDHINPNDVESISILKDAAAASIWGTRSSNGVIVITTKKGNLNQKTAIGFNSVVSTTTKPDLFHNPRLSSADFIEQEEFLFRNGNFNPTLNNRFRPVSEVVEVLARLRNEDINQSEADAILNDLRSHDVRNDMAEYMYRPKTFQQYQFNLSGGSQLNKFYISGGYDRTAEYRMPNSNSRITFDANNTLFLFNNKLELFTGINFTTTQNDFNGNTYTPFSPYERLADGDGNALPVVGNWRLAYVDTAGNGKLLDWHYRPIEELRPDYKVTLNQTRINLSGTYKILPYLNFISSYQYLSGTRESDRVSGEDRYYTRDFINRYSYILGDDVVRPVPIGSIVNTNNQSYNSHIYRFQFQFDKIKLLGDVHEFNALLGYEGSDFRNHTSNYVMYGYDSATRTNANGIIDPLREYPLYYNPASSSRIPTSMNETEAINIGQSIYGNFSYAYKRKYTLSGSFRRDESNLFGVKSNQRAIPLWSTGLAWAVHNEDFYNLNWLSQLNLRITFGYNGNVDKSLSGYMTVRSLGARNIWGAEYSNILNPPNPSLRWEKVKTWNGGIDFSIFKDIVSGSVDVFRKQGIDLIGNGPLAPQTGMPEFRGNTANTQTKGVDLILNTKNIDKEFKWHTSLLMNYNHEVITDYKVQQGRNINIVLNNFTNPLEGYPYYSVFTFRSAGLDGTGMPQGYVNGEVSQDYASINNSSNPDELIFHGSAAPKLFGGLRNTFAYKGIELSVNITFKALYYFRQDNVFAGDTYGFNYSEYERRWQKPGDEYITRIPALTYPSNSSRNIFFQYSEDVVHRADHIRLQDMRCAYHLDSPIFKRIGISGTQVFAYVNNLGIIWGKNNSKIDPDYRTSEFVEPVHFSLGLNMKL